MKIIIIESVFHAKDDECRGEQEWKQYFVLENKCDSVSGNWKWQVMHV